MIATETIQAEIFKGFHPTSKVWIYSSNRMLIDSEAEQINSNLVEFTKQWVSHNIALKASGKVFYNRFVVLVVDESVENPGGCSIDKSVHFIKSIESQFDLKLFDRLTLYYKSGTEMKSFHFNDLKSKITSGEISENTEIYDTTLTQLGLFQTEFIKEAGQSWLSKFIN